MRTVAIVGGSLAGLGAARALRDQQFDGRIVVVGAEDRLPYDRPPLSKDFLAGEVGLEDLALTTADDDGLDLDWRLGVPAARLDRAAAAVVLASGEEIGADGVVVATGARARPFPVAQLGGVHTLRTVDDALALRDELRAGARLVVIGAGFIGAEVASTARALGVDVTVIEATPAPLAGVLGPDLGAVCAGLHGEHGVRLICGVGVTRLLGDGRVRGVELADGRVEPADAVVVGIGALPNVEWLAGSGVAVGPGGVRTDAAGATNIAQVVAAGDCTLSDCSFAGTALRQEHWHTHCSSPSPPWRACSGGRSRRRVRSPPTSGRTSTGRACSSPGTACPATRSRSSRATSSPAGSWPATGATASSSRSSR